MRTEKDDTIALTPDGDASGELRSPEYCVTFWKREEPDEPEFRFSTRRYRCKQATSVTEVISWAEKNVQPEEDFAVLFPYTCTDELGKPYESMYLIYGTYPDGIETSPGPDFGWTMWKMTNT